MGWLLWFVPIVLGIVLLIALANRPQPPPRPGTIMHWTPRSNVSRPAPRPPRPASPGPIARLSPGGPLHAA